ncbi:hypothetical protein BDW02DRAFT_576520 [Decorospora gaudefroyi]|uniref:Uncharacterized protein n=1 Tax=Decorospora gaudefroyi TaxID=184978 RepID=A0A6A5KTJ2_9PLEO|nr:hypothetical protein BDW02DRAFT_576520 [Decorospora gaudefroyi]
MATGCSLTRVRIIISGLFAPAQGARLAANRLWETSGGAKNCDMASGKAMLQAAGRVVSPWPGPPRVTAANLAPLQTVRGSEGCNRCSTGTRLEQSAAGEKRMGSWTGPPLVHSWPRRESARPSAASNF